MSEIDGSSNNTVSGNNVIANNGEGLFLLVNSTGNMIFHNNLYGNSSLVFSRAGSINAWNDGYPSGGNFWSGYSGIDTKKVLTKINQEATVSETLRML
jgi:parallel beta-helix repeat protein